MISYLHLSSFKAGKSKIYFILRVEISILNQYIRISMINETISNYWNFEQGVFGMWGSREE